MQGAACASASCRCRWRGSFKASSARSHARRATMKRTLSWFASHRGVPEGTSSAFGTKMQTAMTLSSSGFFFRISLTCLCSCQLCYHGRVDNHSRVPYHSVVKSKEDGSYLSSHVVFSALFEKEKGLLMASLWYWCVFAFVVWSTHL